MTGLMWFGLNDYNGNQGSRSLNETSLVQDLYETPAEIRYTAEQSDALTSYSYTQHDGRYYASQDLVDGKNNVKLTVAWLKSEDGSDWSVRVEGDAIDPGEPARMEMDMGCTDGWIRPTR